MGRPRRESLTLGTKWLRVVTGKDQTGATRLYLRAPVGGPYLAADTVEALVSGLKVGDEVKLQVTARRPAGTAAPTEHES
jgi:hypothetical protein